MDVLVSAIEPRQASQVVKDLTALLPLEQAKVIKYMAWYLYCRLHLRPYSTLANKMF